MQVFISFTLSALCGLPWRDLCLFWQGNGPVVAGLSLSGSGLDTNCDYFASRLVDRTRVQFIVFLASSLVRI